MSESSDSEREAPYDFSDWQLGEDALTHVETAAYEIMENALRDDSQEAYDPDFGMLHESVENLVRDQLKIAFEGFDAGEWVISREADAKLSWAPGKDLFCEDPSPVFIEIRPRQLVPLFLAELSLRVAVKGRVSRISIGMVRGSEPLMQ